MNNTKPVIWILKGISLLILDVIILLLVFSIWSIINLPLFPWALTAIIFSLGLINVVVLISKEAIRIFGVGAYASITFATCLYFTIILIYTGSIYAFASQRGYVITVLIISLVYVVGIVGLYLSGVNHSTDLNRQKVEREQVMNINLQIMNLSNSINDANTYIEKGKYDNIVSSFEAMKERLLFSTPFGRISKPIVIEMEEKLSAMLVVLNDEIISINNVSNKQSTCDSIIKNLSDIKILIMNREKLIIQ